MKFSKEDLNMNRPLSTMMILLLIYLLAQRSASFVSAFLGRHWASRGSVLGPWAENPETATRNYPPINRSSFDPAKARQGWLKEVQRGQRGLPWLKNPSGDPQQMEANP